LDGAPVRPVTVSLERLAYAAVLVVATLAGLASTLLGLFLDWRAMALVAVGIAATGTIVLQSRIPPTAEAVGFLLDSA
jgi:uncharacterized membrane protein YgaE (UPF0421/DUF939 family)